jgi:NADPH-dependent 2,4-dienoyl-CoA reductase/sulfur reductase-like enzyme
MARQRLVVVGGDAAGMSAASQVRRLRKDMDIVVFERGPHTSYAACGIPFYIGGLVADERRLIARSPREFQEEHNIDARALTEVEALDLDRRTVRFRSVLTGAPGELAFDALLLATGTEPLLPDVPGKENRGIFVVNTLENALRLKRFLEETRPRRAVVVGGGYIGLEMAEALRCHLGMEVTVVERAPQVMKTLDPDMADSVAKALEKAGIRLFLGEALTGFEAEGTRVGAVVTDRRILQTDLVILALGVRPNSKLAAEAGIPLGVRNAIRVDERMRTPLPGIWAAGDCAEVNHLVSARPTHVALGTIANKTGRVAGISIAGGDAAFPGTAATAVCRICSCEIGRTGLTEEEAAELALSVVTATISAETKASYYPDAEPVTVKLLAEKGTGRLLGGQITGGTGAAKRIDVVATALSAGLTVQAMVDLDLAYAPPFSPVWDPVQVAARQLEKLV